MDFLQQLKKELKPKYEEPKIVHELQQSLNELKIDAKTMLGGSVAQKTNIKGNFDADIFVKFKETTNISDKLEQAIKKLKKPYTRIKGSRDYFQIHADITIEAVPVLDIKNYKEAKTVVDVSPLHVEYFNKHANDQIRDEIRLVKAFCKANQLYGAESHIKGLSGHVINLLMLKYKTFQEFIKNTAKWKQKTIIDLEKHHKDPLMILNTSKTTGPLIVIDPVQKNRNAAAALSQQKFEELIKTAKQYKKNPSKQFFEPIQPKNGIQITFELLDGKKDVTGSKIIKIKNYLEQKLKKHDFEPNTKIIFYENRAILTLNPDPKQLGDEKIIKGPPKEMLEHTKKFKEKYKNTTIKENNVVAITKRKYKEPLKLIKDLLTHKYVTTKTKKIMIEDKRK